MAIITVTTDDGEIVESYQTGSGIPSSHTAKLGDDFDIEQNGHWHSLTDDLRHDMRRALAHEEYVRAEA